MEAKHTPGPWKIKARHTDKGVRNTVYAKKEKRNAPEGASLKRQSTTPTLGMSFDLPYKGTWTRTGSHS